MKRKTVWLQISCPLLPFSTAYISRDTFLGVQRVAVPQSCPPVMVVRGILAGSSSTLSQLPENRAFDPKTAAGFRTIAAGLPCAHPQMRARATPATLLDR